MRKYLQIYRNLIAHCDALAGCGGGGREKGGDRGIDAATRRVIYHPGVIMSAGTRCVRRFACVLLSSLMPPKRKVYCNCYDSWVTTETYKAHLQALQGLPRIRKPKERKLRRLKYVIHNFIKITKAKAYKDTIFVASRVNNQ